MRDRGYDRIGWLLVIALLAVGALVGATLALGPLAIAFGRWAEGR